MRGRKDVRDLDQMAITAYNTLTGQRFAKVGMTAGGRVLGVIFTLRSGKIRVVTAFPVKGWIERTYRALRGGAVTNTPQREDDPEEDEFIIIDDFAEVPLLETEEEEHAFWTTHRWSVEAMMKAPPLPDDVRAVLALAAFQADRAGRE